MNTKIVDFLPAGHETLKTEKKYWKLSQFKEGDSKFRIVARPICGWVDWKDKKPLRYRPENKPKYSVDPSKPMRAFWACYVWDYEREDLFILEITQTSIIKAIASFGSDEDWGDFTQYDFKMKKEGTGMESRYHLTPLPHKKLNEKVLTALATSPVRLEALYEGRDPWIDLEASPESEPKASEVKSEMITDQQLEKIERFLQSYPDKKEKIMKFANVDSLDKMSSSTFEKVSQIIDTHLKKEGVA